MGKSYKYPIYTDNGNHRKYAKRLSNKKIRKYLKNFKVGFKSSNFFKLIENQYNICDYKFKPNKEGIIKAKRK